jgi:hypothetical protein
VSLANFLRNLRAFFSPTRRAQRRADAEVARVVDEEAARARAAFRGSPATIMDDGETVTVVNTTPSIYWRLKTLSRFGFGPHDAARYCRAEFLYFLANEVDLTDRDVMAFCKRYMAVIEVMK